MLFLSNIVNINIKHIIITNAKKEIIKLKAREITNSTRLIEISETEIDIPLPE